MAELAEKIEQLGRAFDEFKAANDQRLDQIKKNGHAPADLIEKVEKLNAAVGTLNAEKERIDKIEAALNRGEYKFGGADPDAKAKAEHKKAFARFVRKGSADGLRDLEINAGLTTQVDEDGGAIVPEELDKNIERVMGTMSAMRRLSRVQPVGSITYKKIVNQGGTIAGWVGEEQPRPKTATPKLAPLEFPTQELYASPAATQTILDDAFFNVESWLSEEVGIAFAEQEGGAFITGNGVLKPRGILSYPTVDNASYSWGNIGVVASGASGAFAASDPEDALVDLVHALKAGYRQNASWLMNDLTFAAIRKMKNVNGDMLWVPGLRAGEADMLLGKPVEVDDNMPDIAADSLSIAFGDFRRAYVITDRMGVRVLRDAYTDKPNVIFYSTKRVGGGVQNFEALKLMQFSS